MKKLVVVRHGDYSSAGYPDEPLSERGCAQISNLADKLKTHVDGESMFMVSSTARRAKQSAEILSSEFGVSFEENDLLWSGGGGRVRGCSSDFEQLMQLLESNLVQVDVVVLVTHYEYVDDFPGWFGKKHLNADLCGGVIPKGTAWLIDCEQGQMTHIG